MKLGALSGFSAGVWATSTFVGIVAVGIVAVVPASLAQGDGTATLEMSRTQQVGSMATSSRIAPPGPAPTLEGNRPAAGMFPQPTGPVRGASGQASNAPQESSDLRNSLSRQ
jgi:hypothetical protein